MTIVIPSRDVENLATALASIRQAGELARVIVVDDGLAEDAAARGLEGALEWIHQAAQIVPGERPFNFPRNANLGIDAAGLEDVILMNDDATLETPRGFTEMVEARGRDYGWEYGLVSPAIRENVGQLRQLQRRGSDGIREEPRVLCFVCIFIPREVYQVLGPLDERFCYYGCDDDDYCRRARLAGLRLGIWDRCLVGHAGRSTFRSVPGSQEKLELARELLRKKWEGVK